MVVVVVVGAGVVVGAVVVVGAGVVVGAVVVVGAGVVVVVVVLTHAEEDVAPVPVLDVPTGQEVHTDCPGKAW